MKTSFNSQQSLLVIFLLFFSSSILLRGQSVEWAIPFGGQFDDSGANVTVDSEGNSYLTGFFSQTVDFDPGNAGGELTAETNVDMFLMKRNNEGAFQWVVRPDRYIDQGSTAIAITHDNEGNIILEYFALQEGEDVVRVKKYTPNGELLWTNDLEWFGFVGIGQPEAIDENIIVIDAVCNDSFYNRPISFLDGNGTCVKINEINDDDGFISWDEYIEYDNSIKMLGEVYGTVELNWNNTPITIGEGIFFEDVDWRRSNIIADISTDGNLNEIKILNYGSNDQENGFTNAIFNFKMGFDSQGNLYTYTLSIGIVEYGVPPNSTVVNHGLSGQGVLAKYDPDGNFLWLETWEAPASGITTDMTIDSDDNILIAFSIDGTFDANPKEGTFLHEPISPGSSNLVIVSLDANGDYNWSEALGVTYGRFELDANDNLLVNGSFSNDFNIDTDNGTVAFTNQGFTDGYLLKLKPESNPSSSSQPLETTSHIQVYPNPTNDFIYFEDASSIRYYQVRNMYGSEVMEGILLDNRIDLRSLSPGLYHCFLYDNQGNHQSINRIIKSQ